MPEVTEAQRARRKRRNLQRKAARRKAAEIKALPPVTALSRQAFRMLVGTDADYDLYAAQFIAEAKAKGRRYEFPLEPLAGASFPSFKRHRKGMAAGV